MTILSKAGRLWKYGLVGLICGVATSLMAAYAGEGWRHFPGLVFGIGMAIFLRKPASEGRVKWSILVIAFIGLSTTAFLMAVEVARQVFELLPYGQPSEQLPICGFVAGVFGAAKLTAVVQLTRLRAMATWQWAVCPLTGGVFGLLLYPFLECTTLGIPEQFGPAILFIPWQTAVAMALMGFGPPLDRQSVIAAKRH